MKTHLEIEIDVDFDYNPPEPMTRNYPGCPEEIIPHTFLINGRDIADYKQVEFKRFDELLDGLSEAAKYGRIELVNRFLGMIQTQVKYMKKSPSMEDLLYPLLDEEAERFEDEFRERMIAQEHEYEMV